MSRQIICTVGTSLLTNKEDNRPWAGWNQRKPDPLPDAAEVRRWLADADPVKASAARPLADLLHQSLSEAVQARLKKGGISVSAEVQRDGNKVIIVSIKPTE
jgi:hypothetical protein